MKSMAAGLKTLIKAGLIEEEPVEPLAALLVGALSESGMALAHANGNEAARKETLGALDRFLDRLKKQ
jgi:hypothetical protein